VIPLTAKQLPQFYRERSDMAGRNDGLQSRRRPTISPTDVVTDSPYHSLPTTAPPPDGRSQFVLPVISGLAVRRARFARTRSAAAPRTRRTAPAGAFVQPPPIDADTRAVTATALHAGDTRFAACVASRAHFAARAAADARRASCACAAGRARLDSRATRQRVRVRGTAHIRYTRRALRAVSV